MIHVGVHAVEPLFSNGAVLAGWLQSTRVKIKSYIMDHSTPKSSSTVTNPRRQRCSSTVVLQHARSRGMSKPITRYVRPAKTPIRLDYVETTN